MGETLTTYLTIFRGDKAILLVLFFKNYFDLNLNGRILRNHTKLGRYIEKLFKNVLRKDHSFKPFILEVIESQSWHFGKNMLILWSKVQTFCQEGRRSLKLCYK